MIFNIVPLLVMAGLAMSSPHSSPSGTLGRRNDFKYSCRSFWINGTYHTLLQGECNDGKGNWKRSDLSLNRCMANIGGRLVGAKDGSYNESCDIHSCKLSGSEISCNCKDYGQHWFTTTLDLNDIITNEFGELACYGHRGL